MLEGKHEPFDDVPCWLNGKDEKHAEAVKYCEKCLVFMCGPCCVNHLNCPLFVSHQLLSKSQLGTVTKTKPVSSPLKRCLKHPDEFISFFCGTHYVSCCSACKAFEHSKCAKTQNLTDAAKGVQISQEYKIIKEETNILLTDVVRVLADRKADISRVDNEIRNVKQTITDFRKKVNKYFDDLEEQTLDELYNKAEMTVRSCEQDTKELTIMKSKAEKILKQIELFKGDNECDIFIKSGKQFLSNSSNKVLTGLKSVQKDVIIFRLDPEIEQFLGSIKVLGTFQGVQTDISRPATVPADENISQPLVPVLSSHTSPDCRFPLRKYKARLHGTVYVKEKSDSYVCHISDICQLSNGTILITDYSNKKLKRLEDKSYKLLDSLRLPSKPQNVCTAGPGEVAVSLCSDKKIQFISVENKLALTRSFITGGFCRGMVNVNGILYVCSTGASDLSSGCIEVQLQHSIPHAPRGLSSLPLWITVSDDDQHLFVTSHNCNDVTMMDLTGNEINKFSDTNLKQPTAMCTDGKGHVFICGYNSHTVVQLEPKQQKIHVVPGEKDGVKDPEAIFYNRNQSRLML